MENALGAGCQQRSFFFRDGGYTPQVQLYRNAQPLENKRGGAPAGQADGRVFKDMQVEVGRERMAWRGRNSAGSLNGPEQRFSLPAG